MSPSPGAMTRVGRSPRAVSVRIAAREGIEDAANTTGYDEAGALFVVPAPTRRAPSGTPVPSQPPADPATVVRASDRRRFRVSLRPASGFAAFVPAPGSRRSSRRQRPVSRWLSPPKPSLAGRRFASMRRGRFPCARDVSLSGRRDAGETRTHARSALTLSEYRRCIAGMGMASMPPCLSSLTPAPPAARHEPGCIRASESAGICAWNRELRR